MYEAYFGLTGRPFGETSAFLPLPSREAAARRLRYGLEQADGPALLSGPSGVGKTRLARELARGFGGQVVHLAFPTMPGADLLRFLADEFEAPALPDTGVAGSVRRLRSILTQHANRGARPLLVVDEAHLIVDPAAFEVLRLLLNLTEDGRPALHLLLLGTPEVNGVLPESVEVRLAARCLLAPLTEPETAAYLAGRMAWAGGPTDLFTPDAASALCHAADGLPRRLNYLADLCLLLAYGADARRVDRSLVEIAHRDRSLPELAA